jgi:hypothetical protein
MTPESIRCKSDTFENTAPERHSDAGKEHGRRQRRERLGLRVALEIDVPKSRERGRRKRGCDVREVGMDAPGDRDDRDAR